MSIPSGTYAVHFLVKGNPVRRGTVHVSGESFTGTDEASRATFKGTLGERAPSGTTPVSGTLTLPPSVSLPGKQTSVPQPAEVPLRATLPPNAAQGEPFALELELDRALPPGSRSLGWPRVKLVPGVPAAPQSSTPAAREHSSPAADRKGER